MRLTYTRGASKRGFTLAEILTTIAIVVVLMSIAFGTARLALAKAKEQKAVVQVKLFENRIQEYEADNGEFPPGDGGERSSSSLYQVLYEEGIQQDSKVYMPELDPDASDQFRRKILRDGTILDPFKHKKPYYYLRGTDENGEQVGEAYNPDFDLWSLGPDGEGRGSGGSSADSEEDDITNWDS